ncbi:TolB-like translocation protein [Nonomuraea africana]|uniref:WD40 repeat domain-containing protein n=1 Tax=Nonomuraea africana TaxID=46171 RepID=A0ABR9KSM3_9ACTN|nr:hypothetical protein [Nonomuraea africana]MBE1565038.1 hypothetical protein [Nonomuraea africana]
MNALRDDLHELALEAPSVDLASRALAGARRRRAVQLAVAVAAAVAVVTGGTAILVRGPEPSIVITPQVRPLPSSGVGALQQAFQRQGRWHLVTHDGQSYDAGGIIKGDGPLAITPDGRRIAYFDEKQRTIVLRDLAGGEVWEAPLRLPARTFEAEFALRLSPSGMRMLVAGWGTGRERNVLVDLGDGSVKELDKAWFPVSVSDTGEVVLARPFEDSTRLRVLGHDPITVPDFTYEFSGLAPDGRTIARLGQTHDPGRTPQMEHDGTIVLTDAIAGGDRPKVRISGIPSGLNPARLGAWLSADEVTLLAVPSDRGQTSTVYAVNVRTGQAREFFVTEDAPKNIVPGLVS